MENSDIEIVKVTDSVEAVQKLAVQAERARLRAAVEEKLTPLGDDDMPSHANIVAHGRNQAFLEVLELLSEEAE